MTPSPTLSLAVTTGGRPSPELEAEARRVADELQVAYAARNSGPLAKVFVETQAARLLVFGGDRLRLCNISGGEYFFHPNLAVVRAANLLRGQRDVFADATGLKNGESLLDCTLGFAGEAALGAILVGAAGRVVGLESVPELAAVTRHGLQSFEVPSMPLQNALRRIEVVCADYRDFLPRCATDAFDVVYFDPLFDERLPRSENSVTPLAAFGNPAPLDIDAVQQARRVARHRVVIKHPRHVPLPEELEADVSETLTGRKSRVVYAVLRAI